MPLWAICGEQIAAAEKRSLLIEPNAPGCQMPITLIHGNKPGKTVLITAGIHGDEYPGIAAVIQAAKTLDPANTTGRVILTPCVNVSGFWERQRDLAEDGVNLNAVYPGKEDGTAGERIADFFVKEIFPQVDFVIDLHSGSAMEPLAPCLFFPTGAGEAVRQAAEAAARATDIPCLIASGAATGHYSYAAAKLGIPGLLLERGHSGQCRQAWVEAYCRDISLLLCHLGVYPFSGGEVCAKTVYEKNVYLSAEEQGLWYTSLTENTWVKEGEVLGRLEDFFGNPVAEYRARQDGRVFYYTASLAVKKGQPLVAYGLE